MKKLTSITIILLSSAMFFYSCNNAKVTNSGKITVENGKGEKETINFQCIGCEENIKTIEMFDKVVTQANILTKNSLNYPLSFVPKSVDLIVVKEDSLYYFENNKKIENVIRIISKYSYIGKNSYGNELEGEALNSFYIKDENVTDLENEIKLEILSFDDKYINRTLDGYMNSEFIEFTPTKDKSIIVKSSLSCVDEGSTFKIILENDEEIELKSWNDFNCDGTSYFRWFNKSQINKLKTSRIKYLFIYSRGNSVIVNIPKNKCDYFQQLIDLYK
ncbi:MAG: hypothetical protein FJX80_13625 [Bacteroidetes bacterium]|nr:hypothetical protein [Bacteroidota bacterium]